MVIQIYFQKWLWEKWKNNTKTFSITKRKRKLYCVICGSIENLENVKYYTSYIKTLALSTICGKCKKENEKIFKEEE